MVHSQSLFESDGPLLYIYIYIFMCVTLRNAISRAPGGGARYEFKMASLAVTWVLSSKSGRTKRQRSAQVYCIVLPRKAYYGSQVVCSLCISRDISAVNGQHDRAMRI